MALREILTHQGASAEVFMPNLSLDNAQFFQLEDESVSHRMKRDREIDLNMQGPTDEFEPNLKRPKFTDASSPWMDLMVFPSKDCNSEFSIKAEDGSLDLPSEPINEPSEPIKEPSEPINEFSNVSSVKVEPDSYLNTTLYSNKEVAETTVFTDSSNIKETDVMKKLPENCELMNWVKLARHSWLKNCQFLQECAIRFLCVLSLDRYAFFFILLSVLTISLLS